MGTKAVRTEIVTIKRKVNLYKKKCALCGKSFEGISTAKYCSTSCYNSADYQRHADSRRAKRMAKYRREKATA